MRDDAAAIAYENRLNSDPHFAARNKNRRPKNELPCIIRRVERAIVYFDRISDLIWYLGQPGGFFGVAPRMSVNGRLLGFWWIFNGSAYSDADLPRYSIKSLVGRGVEYNRARDEAQTIRACSHAPDNFVGHYSCEPDGFSERFAAVIARYQSSSNSSPSTS